MVVTGLNGKCRWPGLFEASEHTGGLKDEQNFKPGSPCPESPALGDPKQEDGKGPVLDQPGL